MDHRGSKALVDAAEYREFEAWRESKKRKTIAQAFEELRGICAEEGYVLEPPERRDRENPFTAGDRD